MTRLSPIIFITAFYILVISFVSTNGEGLLAYGEPCDPTPSHKDETERCDTSKRLGCDSNSHACKCQHPDRDFFDEDSGRCETKVGKFCSASDTFPVICVNDAVCNSTTKFCECPPGFETNEEGSECSGGSPEAVNVYLNSLAVVLLLISVFVCT